MALRDICPMDVRPMDEPLIPAPRAPPPPPAKTGDVIASVVKLMTTIFPVIPYFMILYLHSCGASSTAATRYTLQARGWVPAE